MDIRRLEAFVKVYELGSFSKAGEELYLSQPTISAHISSLEKELEVQLFDRLGRSILPTQAGEVLYSHATTLFTGLERARAELELLQNVVSGNLNIGASTIPAHYLLPDKLASFYKQHPDVSIRMTVADSAQITQRIAEGSLAIGVVGATTDHADLEFTPVLDDQLILIASSDDDQGKRSWGIKELLSSPWVMREPGSGTRNALERSLNAIGLGVEQLKVAVEVESTQAVLQFVRAGLGVSVTSRLAAQDFLDRGDIVELDAPVLEMNRQFYLVRHIRRHIFPVVRYFIEHLSRETIS